MMNAIQQVGFIGLGDQGTPMTRAITQKHVLHVRARRSESFRALSGVRHLAAGSARFAKLCNNALTVPKLRNVEVFDLTDKVGSNLRAPQSAFEHSTGGSFIPGSRISDIETIDKRGALVIEDFVRGVVEQDEDVAAEEPRRFETVGRG